MNAENLLSIANILFLFGTSFLFIKVIKNKEALRDFDVVGSGLTFLGMIFSAIAIIELNMWRPLFLLFPTITFWCFVFIYSYKNNK